MISQIKEHYSISKLKQNWDYTLAISLFVLWQAFTIIHSAPCYIDTDTYTHALRLMDLIQSKNWAETPFMHDNYPFGEILPYTRIMDIFFLFTVLPLLPFLTVKNAVFWGGFFTVPFIGLLSTIALLKIGRTFGSKKTAFFVFVAYFSQFSVIELFFAGRPDHHALLNFFHILMILGIFKFVYMQDKFWIKFTGACVGLAIWTSPEGCVGALLTFSGLTLAYFFNCFELKNITQLTFYSTIAILICLLINPPFEGFFYIDSGRLSFFHFFIFLLITLSFFTLGKIDPQTLTKKITFLSILGLLTIFIVYFSFGKNVFFPPIDQELNEAWSVTTIELLPPKTFFEKNIFIRINYIPLVFCLFAYIHANKEQKKFLFSSTLPFIGLFVGTIFWRRCGRTEAPFLAINFILSFYIVSSHFKFFKRTLGKYCVGIPVTAYLLFAIKITIMSAVENMYAARAMNFYEPETTAYLSKKAGTILTTIGDGPEIAWWSGKTTLAFPNHTNRQGIIDNYKILNSSDDDFVIQKLKERNISDIMLRTIGRQQLIEKSTNKETGKIDVEILKKFFPEEFLKNFGWKLIFGLHNYCFITETKVPEEYNKGFQFFQVDFEKCDVNLR